MVEVVVVLLIVSVGIALTIPAVTQSRETARKLHCMNNLRNLTVAISQFDLAQNRLPPSGSFLHDDLLRPHPYLNWAVSILPYLEQQSVYDRIDLDSPITSAENREATSVHIPVFVCPMDLSRSEEKLNDLSYAVNGGIGFTVKLSTGVRDCPVDVELRPLDLDGNGIGCSGSAEMDDIDRQRFRMMSLFFLETANTDITKRHHTLGDIMDGASQTLMISENARIGYDPLISRGGFSESDPFYCAFYTGNPCRDGTCSQGNVDYRRCNAGTQKINSGLWSAEGTSSAPNSFHAGGVNMGFADGHVRFLSEDIDGAVYSALSTPQGILLEGSLLRQPVVPGEEL